MTNFARDQHQPGYSEILVPKGLELFGEAGAYSAHTVERLGLGTIIEFIPGSRTLLLRDADEATYCYVAFEPRARQPVTICWEENPVRPTGPLRDAAVQAV